MHLSKIDNGRARARKTKLWDRIGDASAAVVEGLEKRVLMSVNVLTYRNDPNSDGANSNEVQLSSANVKVGSFGKLSTTSVDGNVYAQPLIDTGVTIATGVNTTAGSAGVHDVAYVATENDSLYAIDASVGGKGKILWQRSFLEQTPNGNVNPGSGSGVLGDQDESLANTTVVDTLTTTDVGVADISPTIGITGTPVIDPANNAIYLVVKTKESTVVNGVTTTYFVQRLHAINLSDGTDVVAPYVIGTTIDVKSGNTDTYTNNSPIYVYGTGDGSVTDPYNGTGKKVVQFNALREAERQALSLVNGQLYVSWASHGDNGPYHGFIARWNVSDLQGTDSAGGFQLNGVLCSSPNDGESGFWGGGGRLVFEPNPSGSSQPTSDTFYALTGNGTGGAPVLNAQGFPSNANYNEALIKVQPDATTSPANQNSNGWGMKITDYFIPYNVTALDGADSDFGSGAPRYYPITLRGRLSRNT